MTDLRKYFNKKKPVGAVVLIIFGIMFFLLGISIDGAFLWIVIGLVMSGFGIYIIAKHNKYQSDVAIDAFCNNLASEYSINKNAVVESYEEPVMEKIYSCGYCFENLFSTRKAIRGRDGVWRSTIFEMSCIFLTETNVYYYCKKQSLITDEKLEKQKSFCVKDIQMVSLEELNQSIVVAVTIPGNEKLYVNCKNKEEAIALCDKIKSILK